MALTILFFGRLRDIAATSSITAEVSFSDVAGLSAWLTGQNAALGEALAAPGTRVAVNQRFVNRDTSLQGAREVAFMSPLSGG